MDTLAQAHTLPEWKYVGAATRPTPSSTIIKLQAPEGSQVFVDQGTRAPGILGTLHTPGRVFTLEEDKPGTWVAYEQPLGDTLEIMSPHPAAVVTTDDFLVFRPGDDKNDATVRVDSLVEEPIAAVGLCVWAQLRRLP